MIASFKLLPQNQSLSSFKLHSISICIAMFIRKHMYLFDLILLYNKISACLCGHTIYTSLCWKILFPPQKINSDVRLIDQNLVGQLGQELFSTPCVFSSKRSTFNCLLLIVAETETHL